MVTAGRGWGAGRDADTDWDAEGVDAATASGCEFGHEAGDVE